MSRNMGPTGSTNSFLSNEEKVCHFSSSNSELSSNVGNVGNSECAKLFALRKNIFLCSLLAALFLERPFTVARIFVPPFGRIFYSFP